MINDLETNYQTEGIVISRITISLDEEVDQKIKELHEILLQKSEKGISTSKTINSLLIAGLLSTSRLHVVEWDKIRDFFAGKRPDLSEFSTEEFVLNIIAMRQWV
jgi:hypothetical protein